MFKEALRTAIQVVFSLPIAWKDISMRKINIYKEFLIPLWIIIIVSSFVGGWLVSRDGTFAVAIKNVITEAFILFISFHVSSFFLHEYINKLTDVDKDMKKTQIFVAYGSSLIYLIQIVVAILNDFFFLWLFTIYTFYIVYVGAEIYFKISSERRTNFMIIASLLILGVPLILRSFLSMITST